MSNVIYEDLSGTKFPAEEDNFDLLEDISAELYPIYNRFQEYVKQNNYLEAARLLIQYPSLEKCMFNARKYNQLRDAIVAVQRYYKQEVREFILSIENKAIGINDNPTDDASAKTNSLSVSKVYELMRNVTYVLVSKDKWTEQNQKFHQRIDVSGITEKNKFQLVKGEIDTNSAAYIKNYNKNFGILCSGTGKTYNGYIIIQIPYKKPNMDLWVGLKGV